MKEYMPETDHVFSNYFRTRIETFILHLNNTRENFDVESLHQMRVEIKKLRAYLSLLEFAGREPVNIRAYKKLLSGLFKPGGKLRETQVNRALLNAYPDWVLPQYNAVLENIEQEQIERLRKEFDGFHMDQLAQYNSHFLEVIIAIPAAEFEELAIGFVKQRFSLIKELLPRISSNKVLHEIRMHLKMTGYILKILIETNVEKPPPSIYALLKELEELIGNWHDKVVFNSHIKRFLKKNKTFEESHDLMGLKQQLKRESKSMVVEITEKFESFYNDNWFDNQK